MVKRTSYCVSGDHGKTHVVSGAIYIDHGKTYVISGAIYIDPWQNACRIHLEKQCCGRRSSVKSGPPVYVLLPVIPTLPSAITHVY